MTALQQYFVTGMFVIFWGARAPESSDHKEWHYPKKKTEIEASFSYPTSFFFSYPWLQSFLLSSKHAPRHQCLVLDCLFNIYSGVNSAWGVVRTCVMRPATSFKRRRGLVETDIQHIMP